MYTSNKFIIISISIILLISGCFGVQKPKDLNNQADLTVLNNFSVDVSQDIYNGKIDFGSKVSLILFADDFYKKTGLPFIGEKIGTTRLQESIKNKKKIAKAIAAYNLSLDGNNANEGSLLLQLKDKDPVVRSVTLIFLGKINREKYSGEIEKLYAKENKPFVKMYALRELFKFKPEKYYDTVLSHISDEDILNRTIAAGILLKEKPEIAEKVLNEALKSKEEIIILRALESLIDKRTLLNEELISSFINSDSFLRTLYSSKILLQANKEKYTDYLKEQLNNTLVNRKLAISISLLESGDDSGLDYIKKALSSDNYIDRLYASKAVIECYKKMGSSG